MKYYIDIDKRMHVILPIPVGLLWRKYLTGSYVNDWSYYDKIKHEWVNIDHNIDYRDMKEASDEEAFELLL